MHLKNKLWKIATAFVVLFFILNPEMAELALFINTIGLELFIMLLEAQLLVFFAGFYSKNIQQNLSSLKNLCIDTCKPYFLTNIKNSPSTILAVIPSAATLMNLLVFSAISPFAISLTTFD